MVWRKGTKVVVLGDWSVGIPSYEGVVVSADGGYVVVKDEYGVKDEVIEDQVIRVNDMRRR